MYLVLFVAAIAVLIMYRNLSKQKKRAGVHGWIKSQDLDGREGRVYRNYQAGISARPDVVESGRVIEHKSAEVKNKARHSDILQVTAEMIATKLDEGELRYGNNRKFQFRKGSPMMRGIMREVQGIAERMKWYLSKRVSPKGTPTKNKCAKCIFQKECSDAVM